MKELRRNEFIDMLEMAGLLYEETDKYVKCDIPSFGGITYYPKSNKLQINKTNTWEQDGLDYSKFLIKEYKELKLSECSISERIKHKSDSELRNEYAGLAMKGLMTIQDKGFFDSTEEMAEKCAEISFIVADAMVKRSKIINEKK